MASRCNEILYVKVSWKLSLPSKICSAAFHPGSTTIIIGTEEGHVVALNGQSGAHVTTLKVCSAQINAMAFDKHGDTVALAAQNGSVYLYKVSREGQTYKKFGKIASGMPGLNHIDWSTNGEFMQTVSKDKVSDIA